VGDGLDDSTVHSTLVLAAATSEVVALPILDLPGPPCGKHAIRSRSEKLYVSLAKYNYLYPLALKEAGAGAGADLGSVGRG
jgi:hypothetical protein